MIEPIKIEPKLCDKCPNTIPHYDHILCIGCNRLSPVPVDMKGFANSKSCCDKCPKDTVSGKIYNMFYR